MDTTELSKLIAEFMGYKHKSELSENLYQHTEKPGHYVRIDESKYHSSWDWLMNVVEKIEKLGYDVQIGKHYCDIETAEGLVSTSRNSGDKKSRVYKAVVEFIKWYNSKN